MNSTGEGTIGRAAVADVSTTDLPLDSHVLVIRCDRDRLSPRYLAAHLRSPSGEAQVNAAKGANTTKRTELGKARLELLFPVQSIAKQQELLAKYERITSCRRL